LRRLVLDPVGRATDYGTTRYAPPRDLCDFVMARDRTCVFPSCTRRAISCDLDHRVPFPYGSTSERNLHPLCRSHHQLKMLGLWTYRHDPATGKTHWTDRHGRTIAGAAATYDAPPTPELDQIARDVRAASPPPPPAPGEPGAGDDPSPF
jgi:hypothetical protein